MLLEDSIVFFFVGFRLIGAFLAKYGALNVEDDSPTVKVEITPITNNGLEVRVKDNGCGMSPQDRSAALGYFAANFCKSA